MKTKIQMILSLYFLTLSSGVFATEGGSGSHGGDTLVMEFTGTQQNISDWYEKNGALTACPSPSDIVDAVRGESRIRVRSELTVFTNGTEVDAVTSPDDQPRATAISRMRLMTKPKDAGYALLTLHEIFVGLKLETTNDTSRSKGCLDSMIASGLSIEKTLVTYKPFGSVVENFNAGTGLLKCEPTRLNEGASFTITANHESISAASSAGGVARDKIPLQIRDYYNLTTGKGEARSDRHECRYYKQGKSGFGYQSKLYWVEIVSDRGTAWTVTLTGTLKNLDPLFGEARTFVTKCEFLYGGR